MVEVLLDLVLKEKWNICSQESLRKALAGREGGVHEKR